jgi:hypothetical protein
VAGIFWVLNSWGFKYKATLCSKGEILMAYAVNSIVGNISGIVAYQDGSNGSFNAEMNYDGETNTIFTANATESRTVLTDLYFTTNENAALDLADNAFRDGFTNLNTVTSTLWASLNWNPYASLTDSGKVIVGVVFHMNYNISFDDGTMYPVSATYEKVGGTYVRTNHTNATNTFSGASNKAAIVTAISDSFKQVLDISSYS